VKKGDRVKITKGPGKDTVGEIFWSGPNKWGGGERYGVRGDDGDTYWVNSADVEAASGPAPKVEAGREYAKGDRVAFKVRGREGTGSVFWIGDSRSGPGQRLGINDDDGEDAVWLDARFVQPLENEPAPQGGGHGGGYGHGGGGGYGGGGGGQEPPADFYSVDDGWVPQDDDGPPSAPISDDYADSYASMEDEESPPDAW
jgi:hypothetical protein